MRTSCIKHPVHEPFLIKHKWQLEACDNDGCAAGLLSLFEYWHNIKLRSQIKAEQANQVAEMHGDAPTQDTSLFQWHNTEELKAALFEYNEKRIRAGIELLKKKGFVSVHRNPNPKYTFDNTKHFLFHSEAVNDWLAKRGNHVKDESIVRQILPDPSRQIDQTVRQNRPDHPAESTGSYSRIDRVVRQNQPEQYPKITSTITSKTTSKVTNDQIAVAQVQPCSMDNVNNIFEHWKRTMQLLDAKLDSKRICVIKQALKSGYSVDELCQAVSGCAATPHNIGENDKGQRFDGLQIIFKDADQIDRFIRNFHKPPRKKNPTLYEKNIASAQIWLEQERIREKERLHVIN